MVEMYNGKPVHIVNGYRVVYCPEHASFGKSSGYNGYAYEHRMIVGMSIGRKLRRDEAVHHIDENKFNNDLSNLRLMSFSEHSSMHTCSPDAERQHCKICGKNLGGTVNRKVKRVYCGDCCRAMWANVSKKPSNEQLQLDCNTMNRTQIAEKYGVSETAVRKWIRKNGIKYEPYHTMKTPEARAESAKKIIETMRGVKRNPYTVPVVQLDSDCKLVREYNSIGSVSDFGFNPRLVGRACKLELKTYYGFRWMRKSEYEEKFRMDRGRTGYAPDFEIGVAPQKCDDENGANSTNSARADNDELRGDEPKCVETIHPAPDCTQG